MCNKKDTVNFFILDCINNKDSFTRVTNPLQIKGNEYTVTTNIPDGSK
jgi:hypothetical protein